ncbi:MULTISPECIES: DUF2127 domain-containing protein [Actinokineospora]|uniref:DUF2127 domain-containing protein n=1 Tax=Actinokineospora fastidiosa TaxID=1816 RepID=A0A918GM18_9PSEU|nr:MULTISPECIES: DUF2127 domain-containing protein [Actinokineospora]UVS77306.1 putative membrane protein [Actinokineospora sp. UTMC 2448]GGS44219.1 hypothetical protein GCM10010171_44250 [Actinokineospora fastidiosa]
MVLRLAATLKGVDGAGQLLAALLLAVVPPAALTGLANAVLTRDLLGDLDGGIAHRLTQHFATGRGFAVAYLLAHGAVKIALAFALLRGRLAVYPVACVVLAAFIVFEAARAVRTGSVALAVLAVIDVVVVVAVARELVRRPDFRQG